MSVFHYHPRFVCCSCGVRYGCTTAWKFSTWHFGACGICGTETNVTDPGNFGHLREDWQKGIPPEHLAVIEQKQQAVREYSIRKL